MPWVENVGVTLKGVTGDTGVRGYSGDTGLQGVTGVHGSSGVQGPPLFTMSPGVGYISNPSNSILCTRDLQTDINVLEKYPSFSLIFTVNTVVATDPSSNIELYTIGSNNGLYAYIYFSTNQSGTGNVINEFGATLTTYTSTDFFNYVISSSRLSFYKNGTLIYSQEIIVLPFYSFKFFISIYTFTFSIY